MPAKTLPLKIGVDAGWQEIVWNGLRNLNRYYWRPAFTVQVGQGSETDDDNWDTVAMINRLSNSVVDGRPFEFTVSPLYNMPLGRIKARRVDGTQLSKSMLAVYYAAHRHLAKMAARDSAPESHGNILSRSATDLTIHYGGALMLRLVEYIAKRAKVDLEKAKVHGLPSGGKAIESWAVAKNTL